MTSDSLVGSVLYDKYKLVRLVGTGEMGAVYEARHTLVEERFAIKLMHSHLAVSDSAIAVFQREVRAAASLGHENIVEVKEMGISSEGAPYIVMEYLEGRDLGRVIGGEGPLSTHRAAKILIQALSALKSAHEAGIIHQDLKPENVFLVEEPGGLESVKLVDFGVFRFRTSDPDAISPAGESPRIHGYLSPEQVRGDQELSPQSDLYSMGVILYQMVTGRLPLGAPDHEATVHDILSGNPPDPLEINPDLPPAMVEIINIAMAREREARFGSSFEFFKLLLPFSHHPGVLQEIENIGFSDTIERNRRSLHIQTEVTIDSSLKIKTIVIDGGVVLDAIVKTEERLGKDIVDQTREAARHQHGAIIEEVTGGKHD